MDLSYRSAFTDAGELRGGYTPDEPRRPGQHFQGRGFLRPGPYPPPLLNAIEVREWLAALAKRPGDSGHASRIASALFVRHASRWSRWPRHSDKARAHIAAFLARYITPQP